MAKSHKERPLPDTLGLPKTGVDSHAHLNNKTLWADFEGVLDRAGKAGVARIGQVFLSHAAYAEYMDDMERRAAALPGAPKLFYLLGIHPTDAHMVEDAEWGRLRADFDADSRLRAVGEIGLDFYWKECPPDVQESAFRVQLAMAREIDMPVVIHSRDAFAQTVAILDEEGFKGRPLLWHCFGGDEAALDALLDRGWHISIPGPVTYGANQALRQAVMRIPADRLLLETDCPYLAPMPWRGQTNEPALSVFTAQAVALAREEDTAALWTQCGLNAAQFFGLNTDMAGPACGTKS